MKESTKAFWRGFTEPMREKTGVDILSFALFDWYLIFSIAVQFICATMLWLLLHHIFGWTWGAYFWAGTAIGFLFYCTDWINQWFMKPLAKHITVLENPLLKREKLSEDMVTHVKPTRTLRAVVGPAYAGRHIFNRVVNNKVINATRSLIISVEMLPVETVEGVRVFVNLTVLATALETADGASCLVQHSEGYVTTYLRVKAIAFIQSRARIRKLNQLFAGLDVDKGGKIVRTAPTVEAVKSTGVLEEDFSKGWMGGKDVVTETENELGVFTNDPTCELILDPDFVKSLQAVATAEQSAKAIEMYVKVGQLDAETAANMDAVNRGKQAPSTVIKYKGLENARTVNVWSGSGRQS